MTTPNKTERANRVSVVPVGDGFEARFVRTHKEVARIPSTETEWTPDPKMNKTLQREMYRLFITEHASEYNVEYDPEDRRSDDNKMPNRYDTDEVLLDTASRMVSTDIQEWVGKIAEEHKDSVISLTSVVGEEISPVMKNRKGADVSHKYNNGAWAWATVRVVATVDMVVKEEHVVGYVTMECSLVSGQLKKPDSIGEGGYTYTGFRTELAKDIPAIAPATKTEDKKEDTTDKKTNSKKGDKKASGK